MGNKWRGHIITDSDGWRYADTGELVANNPNRDCGHCGRSNTADGYDGCLGALPGVMNACCGHGIEEAAYVQFQVDRDVLDRFVEAVGHGQVKGPYKPKSERSNPYYRVEIAGRNRVCEVLTRLWPFLSEVKKNQARAVWEKESCHRGVKSPPMPSLPEISKVVNE